jgi:membrane protein implicated in regulation of membrane protease activity
MAPMLIWLIIAIGLASLGVIEILLNFTIPFIELRVVLLLLLVLGMSYRHYLMERSGEKEALEKRIQELEDKCREIEGEVSDNPGE